VDANELSRRDFIRKTSLAVAAARVRVAGAATASAQNPKTDDTPPILNYNPRMGYRRLGRTGLMISEVALGGHWKDRKGDRYWDEFADEKVPSDVVKNRTDVINACIEAGINYLDIGTAAECLAYGAVLKGRREKMIIAADDYKMTAREAENCTVEKLTFDLDQCLRRLQTDYLDIWRVKADMEGRTTDSNVKIIIETFEKARRAGKARRLAISSHRRPWLRHVIETFSRVEIVSFPCSAATREKDKPVTKENVEEVNAGYGADTDQSIFEAVRKLDIGVVAIKPFLGGNLFKIKRKFPVSEQGDKHEHDLARLTLQCILANNAITTTIPGLTTVREVENAALASYMRRTAPTAAERDWITRLTRKRWQTLPTQYAWLRQWQFV
jgi:aryl-alcohol dehydrogenase-like predicted oxidoreductase